MKKMVIITVLGLLLGLGGAVGIVIVREKQARAAAPLPAADSTATGIDSTRVAALRANSAGSDSISGDSVLRDSLAPVSAHQISGAAGGDSALVGLTAGSPTGVAAAGQVRDSLTAAVAAASASIGGAPGPDEQRLARIFAAMRPEEAARVLEQMTDPEVQRLLSHLRERQAAAIMSNISPQRAAVISSAVIRGERSAP